MTGLVRAPVPGEEELRKKQAQLKRLEARLAQKELELATLQDELRAFEIRYLRKVGSLYWALDDLVAKIAEANAKLHPEKVEVQREAQAARTRAQETTEAVGKAIERGKKKEAEFKPSEDLRKLYRELAKRIHPDLAADDEERVRRTELMAAANKACEEGNAERLKRILEDWEGEAPAEPGKDVSARLNRINRKIDSAKKRLDAIRVEMIELSQSDSVTGRSRNCFFPAEPTWTLSMTAVGQRLNWQSRRGIVT